MTQILDKPVETQEATQIIASEPTPGPYQVRELDKKPLLVSEGQPGEFSSFTPEIWAGNIRLCELKSFVHTHADDTGYCAYPSHSECAANGHLFGASWDLLKAAENALKVLGKLPFTQDEFDAVNELKAAIAKARGQVK